MYKSSHTREQDGAFSPTDTTTIGPPTVNFPTVAIQRCKHRIVWQPGTCEHTHTHTHTHTQTRERFVFRKKWIERDWIFCCCCCCCVCVCVCVTHPIQLHGTRGEIFLKRCQEREKSEKKYIVLSAFAIIIGVRGGDPTANGWKNFEQKRRICDKERNTCHNPTDKVFGFGNTTGGLQIELKQIGKKSNTHKLTNIHTCTYMHTKNKKNTHKCTTCTYIIRGRIPTVKRDIEITCSNDTQSMGRGGGGGGHEK